MGLLQKAIETYEMYERTEKDKKTDPPMAPIGHLIANASLELTLDGEGNLRNAVVIGKEDAKTVIPVTEDSAGRTSAPCPHPLCEQVGYLSGQDSVKYKLYTEQLKVWTESKYSHPMLLPVLTYVRKKTLLTDLDTYGITKIEDKQLIRWKVIGIGEEGGACWKNRSLFQCWSEWYQTIREQEGDKEVCMVTGENTILAKQHLKGIIPINGNAKLLSANDTSNFTYRGRFQNERQTATVGYLASQKAHNALRWLAAEQGVQMVFGGRTFICWNPQGKKIPHSALPMVADHTESVTPTAYKKRLKKALEGYRSELTGTENVDSDSRKRVNWNEVVIATFDAASKGRLALTYYKELEMSDFLQRLYDWDVTCYWSRWDTKEQKMVCASPSLYQIINGAFGVQREEKGKTKLVTDEKLMKQQMQRLLSCRVDKALFPVDIERAIVERASMPQAFDPMVYRRLLSTACAVIKKYYHDYKKEEIEMTLEEKKADRSYQFGRLLAVLNQAEMDFYQNEKRKDPDKQTRQTMAEKSMTLFRRCPLKTYGSIYRHVLEAYVPRIKPYQKTRFNRLCGEITEILDTFSENELDKPLKETYLIGYYVQQQEFYKTTKVETEQQKEREE